MIYGPSIPDNVNHWQVFDNDSQLKHFIACIGNFADIFFEGLENGGKLVREELVESGEVIQLKENKFPWGLDSLVYFFG